ncbi:MAG: hypothetical protein WA667_10605 [Candidatus Nitrosopolaris sp.]
MTKDNDVLWLREGLGHWSEQSYKILSTFLPHFWLILVSSYNFSDGFIDIIAAHVVGS